MLGKVQWWLVTIVSEQIIGTIFKDQEVFLDCLAFEMETVGCPETPVT